MYNCILDVCVAEHRDRGVTRKKPEYHCGSSQGHGGWNIKKEKAKSSLYVLYFCIIIYTPVTGINSFFFIAKPQAIVQRTKKNWPKKPKQNKFS